MQQLTAARIDWTPETIAHFRWWLRDSKSAFAERLPVSRSSIGPWESGVMRPSSDSLRRLDKLAAEYMFYG